LSRMSFEPLASRMRPQKLDDIVGQQHLVGKGRLLRRMLQSGDALRSLVLFGPPGTGKTSITQVIARTVERPFVSINAITSGVKELRDVMDQARWGTIVLHVDECHHFRKDQVEKLLEAVESGKVIFIGTTTENPHLTLPPALRSRSTILELKPLAPADILQALGRAIQDEQNGLARLQPAVAPDALAELAGAAGGDLRVALNALELAVVTLVPAADGSRPITWEWLRECLRKELSSFSESDGYDLISALQKSIRGSDPDAALFYLARLVAVRYDIPSLCRRLVVIAAEDVGVAYPTGTSIAVAAAQAAQMVGYPEARIPLAQAVAFLAACPKSNAAYVGLEKALGDIAAGKGLKVPAHLQSASYQGAASLGRGVAYRYPHDFPGNWVKQQYLPDDLVGARYYEPTENGAEKSIKEKLERIRAD